ncbi:MAG: hypothetical protein CFH31_00648 [Alphaproteobacteria bacterium MarineAlpha9_Bin1]|nr:MAG: hypothetical protein CFH31_00648 [Alphaproteobacteria bacterium MarineAlpha9_Bin1]
MLVFELWKKILIFTISFLALFFCLPNFFDKDSSEDLPAFLNSKQIRLGLDLQGGSYLLLKVEIGEIKKERLNNLADEIRVALRSNDPRIGYKNISIANDKLEFFLLSSDDMNLTTQIIKKIDKDLIVRNDGNTQITLDFSEAKMKDLQVTTVLQSIEIIRRRIDEIGTNEPLIQRQGKDRISVQLPGLEEPERIKKLLGKTARMNFRLVNETASIDEAVSGRIPPGFELLFEIDPSTGQKTIPYIISKRIGVSGDHLIDASPTVDQYNQPVVSLRFDASGSRKFGDLTANNVGKRFAIILDNEVISAPVIREPITGGGGQISGNFTFESASDLAVLLRAGALPAPLTILEERSVGPSLGRDSIKSGTNAAIIALILVALYMFAVYGLVFGLTANLALLINISSILALLGLIGATLTLPGIAGIALTVGMAVDANVLIFERIREELRSGRSIISAIDNGFKQALRTIIDANTTTLIAAVILFQFGSGPVRGFAVTLALGVLTTMFTSILFSRGIISLWFNRIKPSKLNI